MVRETSCAILLCLGICPCRQPHREDRAFARLARHRDVAAHHAGELAGEGEAQVGPPKRWAVVASAWVNSSNSFACCSGAMPMPVSETDSSIQRPPLLTLRPRSA